MQVETIHNTPATPWVFPLQSKIGEHIIRYDGLTEFAQGSPLIGSLFVDDKKIGKDDLFGAPFLLSNNHLYIPKYVRCFLTSGFIFCKIDIRTRQIEHLSKIKPLIYLHCIDDGRILYSTDYIELKE